jgi:hypothetical protein
VLAISVLSPIGAARASTSAVSPPAQNANDQAPESIACDRVEIRRIEDALESRRDLAAECPALKAEYGPSFSYTEYLYEGYKTKTTLGYVLLAVIFQEHDPSWRASFSGA